MSQPPDNAVQAARGVGRLAFEAVEQVTRIVEAMHATIAAAPLPLGNGQRNRTRGVSGLVYRSIRGVNAWVKTGADAALGMLATQVGAQLPQPYADGVRAALNGVLGDHLQHSGNPLAIHMALRQSGQRLPLQREALQALPVVSPRILIAIHGLCMNDRQWTRNGRNHVEDIAQLDGSTPLYLLYNSGRHISENGRELAGLLDQLVCQWPVPVEEITLLTHSMGGLVARSACHYAARSGWRARLRRIIFLGTPHHGAPLERGGHWLQTLAGISPYTAPLARLGMVRSAGVTDLRHGNLIDEDWQPRDRFETHHDLRHLQPLPAGAACYSYAATLGQRNADLADRALGDGLVPLDSALGRHPNPDFRLAFADSQVAIGYGMNHWDLLDHPRVAEQLRTWVASG